MLVKVAWVLCAASAVGASSSQRKYDGSTLSYDPKGRMFQVEYAVEATRRGRTVLGVCGEGCVVLMTRDPSPPSSCRAVGTEGGVWAVDTHVGIAASGLRSDIQYVVDCARTWCSEHRFVFGGPMPCQMLARRVADLVHACTTRGGKRPLAVDILVGGVEEHGGASLHQVQATGAFQRYRAVAAGGGGAEATARLASDDPINRVSSDRGRGAGGGDGVGVEGLAVAVAGEESGSSSSSSSRHRLRPLLPEHRVVLKRAVSALWEPLGGGGGRRSGGGGSGEGGRDAELDRRGERAHGGLRASELSAAIYGKQQRAASWRDGGGRTGSHASYHRAGDSKNDVEEDGERAWDQGVGCSPEDFEEILLELEVEEKNAN